MKISFVVAKSKNNVIGKNNKLPWHLPADLQHFKEITMGKPIIMGRKTFDSIGKPLPGRRNIVISRQTQHIPGCDVFHSIDDALTSVATEKEIMIIGGETLFQQLLPRAHRIYMTVIDAIIDGDTFFPALNSAEWSLQSDEKHLPDQKNNYPYHFQVFERR